MDYKQALEYINGASWRGSRLGLERISELLARMGNPQSELKFVHVAGTNGKGSILSYTKNILMDARYRVGCYSSPSVFGYLERFQLSLIHI